MKTFTYVTYADYSDLDGRLKQAKPTLEIFLYLVRKSTHLIIDYFMLKGSSGGQHVSLSSLRQEQSH